MASKSRNDPRTGDGASPGKIFIGGLAKDTTYATFNKHFGRYGEIIDSVIMKDRFSGQPRGFGFITFADPSVVDKVMEETHVLNGKQVEIKRTIPKGAGQSSKDFKTKKIFVGGVPSTVTDDEFKSFFSKYGTVAEHQIIRDHETNRSRGFGFIIYDNEDVVDEILSNGNRIDMAGTQVEIKKAEPKKASNPSPAPPAYDSNPRARSFGDGYGGGGFNSSYGGYEGGFGPASYRTPVIGSRLGSGYGGGYSSPLGGEFGGSYGGYGGSRYGESSLGPTYSSRLGPYGGTYGGGYGASGPYGRGGEVGYGAYGGSGYGGGYEPGPGASYGGGAGGHYGRQGYSGANSRYHPYAR